MLLEETPDRAELEQRSRRNSKRMQAETDAELEVACSNSTTRPEIAAVLQAIRGVLNRRRYIQNLVRDVEKALALELHMSTFQIDFGQQQKPCRRHRPRHDQQPCRRHGPTGQPEIIPARMDRRSFRPSSRLVRTGEVLVGAAARGRPADAPGTHRLLGQAADGPRHRRRSGRTEAVSVSDRRRLGIGNPASTRRSHVHTAADRRRGPAAT